MKPQVVGKDLNDLPTMLRQAETRQPETLSGTVNSMADLAIDVLRAVANDASGIDAIRAHTQASNCSKLVYMFDSEQPLDDTLSLIPLDSFRMHVLIPEPTWSKTGVRDVFAARLGASVVGDNRLQIGGEGNVRSVWSTVRGDWRKRETRYTLFCPVCKKNGTTKQKEITDTATGATRKITIHPTVFILGRNHGICRVCRTQISWPALVVGDHVRYSAESRHSAEDIHLHRGDRDVAIIDRMKYALVGQVRDEARAPITRAFAVPFRLYVTRRADATAMDSSMLDMAGFTKLITQWAKSGTTLWNSRASQAGVISLVENTTRGLVIGIEAGTLHTITLPAAFQPKVVVGQEVKFGDMLAEPPRLTAEQLRLHPQRTAIAEAILTGFTRFEPVVTASYSAEDTSKVTGLSIDRTRASGTVYYPIEVVAAEHRGSVYVWYDRTVVRPATPVICTDKVCSYAGNPADGKVVMKRVLQGATEKVVFDFFSGVLDNAQLAASHAAEEADKDAIVDMIRERRRQAIKTSRAQKATTEVTPEVTPEVTAEVTAEVAAPSAEVQPETELPLEIPVQSAEHAV
jgi:hypothetical protein